MSRSRWLPLNELSKRWIATPAFAQQVDVLGEWAARVHEAGAGATTHHSGHPPDATAPRHFATVRTLIPRAAAIR
jgi:hypothetical protein